MPAAKFKVERFIKMQNGRKPAGATYQSDPPAEMKGRALAPPFYYISRGHIARWYIGRCSSDVMAIRRFYCCGRDLWRSKLVPVVNGEVCSGFMMRFEFEWCGFMEFCWGLYPFDGLEVMDG